MVRAKFFVSSVTHTADGGSVELHPVTSENEENKKYFRWTPGGVIQMSVLNRDALNQFVPGKAYYVDFIAEEEN